jgi:hypothetical protein
VVCMVAAVCLSWCPQHACLSSKLCSYLPAHYTVPLHHPCNLGLQVPSKSFLPEEEEPGEPQASYSYALAEAAAKARGVMQAHEVWRGRGGEGQCIWASYGRRAVRSVGEAAWPINLSAVRVLCLAGAAGVAWRRLAGRVAAPAAAWRARSLR